MSILWDLVFFVFLFVHILFRMDGYSDGYFQKFHIKPVLNEILMSSDKLRYIVDMGDSAADTGGAVFDAYVDAIEEPRVQDSEIWDDSYMEDGC